MIVTLSQTITLLTKARQSNQVILRVEGTPKTILLSLSPALSVLRIYSSTRFEVATFGVKMASICSSLLLGAPPTTKIASGLFTCSMQIVFVIKIWPITIMLSRVIIRATII